MGASSSRDSDPSGPVLEPGLERTGRKLSRPAGWFLALAVLLWVPGILVLVLSVTWVGILLLLLGSLPGALGLGLLGSGIISRWTARRRSFA